MDECVSQTELAFDQVVATLTSNGETSVVDQRGADEEGRNFEGDDRYDAVLRMNEEFIGRDWGDGFPLHPATRQAVDNLLTGTCLSPDDEVCDVPPWIWDCDGRKDRSKRCLGRRKPGTHAGDHCRS